jgi:hypothetical protein
MKEHPILFSAPMVQAILEGRKTQTRRVVKPVGKDEGFIVVGGHDRDPNQWPFRSYDGEAFDDGNGCEVPLVCPYGVPGDRLWVRETCGVFAVNGCSVGIGYRADHPADGDLSKTDGGYSFRYLESMEELEATEKMVNAERWRPSIFMPRWASRITLEITEVRRTASAGDQSRRYRGRRRLRHQLQGLSHRGV